MGSKCLKYREDSKLSPHLTVIIGVHDDPWTTKRGTMCPEGMPNTMLASRHSTLLQWQTTVLGGFGSSEEQMHPKEANGHAPRWGVHTPNRPGHCPMEPKWQQSLAKDRVFWVFEGNVGGF